MLRQFSKSISRGQAASKSIQKRGLAFASPSHRAKEATVSLERAIYSRSIEM